MRVPSLDVLLPFYGPPARLRIAVESVLAQTSDDWRLIVADDAWPHDDVRPWLDGLGDPRVVYHRNPVNLGLDANFQHLLELAEAERVCFLGGDDLMLPTYVATVLAAARETGAALVHPGVRVVDADGAAVRPLTDRVKGAIAPRPGSVLAGERLATSLVRGNWTYFPAVCLDRRAALAHGFEAPFPTILDLRLMLQMTFAGASLAVVGEECFAYRRHRESFSEVNARSVVRFDEEDALQAWVVAEARARGWSTTVRAARLRPFSRLHALTLLPASLRGDRTTARRLARHALGRTGR